VPPVSLSFLRGGLAADEAWLAELLRREHTGASAERVERLLAGVRRDRRLVRELHELYGGRCQVCAFDSPAVYGAPSAEGHHLVYLSRGGEDSLANVVLLCLTHHAVVHKADATFDHGRLAFLFPNGRAKPLCLNRYLVQA
jgi:5-methylcytosine-specific restriction enzyme A